LGQTGFVKKNRLRVWDEEQFPPFWDKLFWLKSLCLERLASLGLDLGMQKWVSLERSQPAASYLKRFW